MRIVVLAPILLAAVLAAQEGIPDGAKVTRDVRYTVTEGVPAKLQSLDVYAPEDARDAPILVFVHGGGWRGGDKANGGVIGHKVAHFLARGFVFVSVNYRLSPAVTHPAHVEDVAAAIGWVRENAVRIGGDPERMFVAGHSAGAHLAALVATDERRLAACGETIGAIRGVVLLDGAGYDLESLARESRVGRGRLLYSAAFGPPGEAWLDASPMAHLAAGKGIPPFLIVHAGPRQAAADAARALQRALGRAGTPAEIWHAADKDHAGVNRDLGREGDPLTATVTAFLERLAGSPEEQPVRDERFAAIDAKLEAIVDTGRVPGLSLVLVTVDRILHTATAGTGDVAVAIPIASATKVPTVTAFLTLVDRGLVELDAPVARYLEDWPGSAADVTVRQLLSCTSGFGNEGRFRAMRARTLAESVRLLTGNGPIAAPGTGFHYGGTGFQVAGRIAEVVTDRDWHDFFASAVAEPLGLSTFTYGDRGAPWLGGGASCSALDYAKLLQLHLADGEFDGQRVLSEAMTREMRRDHTDGLVQERNPFPDRRPYGLAFWLTPAGKENAPVVEFSDPGAFGATPWLDIERGYGAVLLPHGERPELPARGGMRTAMPIWGELRPFVQAAIAEHGGPARSAGRGPTDR